MPASPAGGDDDDCDASITSALPSSLLPTFEFDERHIVCTINGGGTSADGQGSSRLDRPFWRQVAWSPDGTHLLAQSDDHHLDLFSLQRESSHDDKLCLVTSVRAPTTLLAFAWYPFARYDDPASWCFVMSARDVPVRLLDAYQGKTRATYGIVDHTERFVGPSAIAFSLDGQHLYCAHDTNLSTFALAQPGINSHTQMQLTSSRRATRKGKVAAGQRGTISCIAVTSDRIAGSEQELVAIGTFAGTVGVYRMDLGTRRGEEACVLGWKEIPAYGVVQVLFHPTSPYILFVASRRSDEVRAYDLRYVGTRRSFLHPPSGVALLATFPRAQEDAERATQQRLFFDIDRTGRFLLAGDATGILSVWSIATAEEDAFAAEQSPSSFGRILKPNEAPHQATTHSWKGADDAVSCVAFHPYAPLILIASGSRRWTRDSKRNSSASIEEEGDSRDCQDEYYSSGFEVRDGALRLCRVAFAGREAAELSGAKE